MGRVSGIYEEPRELIRAVPGAEFVEMELQPREGALLRQRPDVCSSDPPAAHDIGKGAPRGGVEAGAEKMLALCPCCQFQLRVSAEKSDVPVEVDDLAHYSRRALGYELPDPNPEVQRQWAVFEGMIALMTPKGFAELMGTMWPELIDAMPDRHGRR